MAWSRLCIVRKIESNFLPLPAGPRNPRVPVFRPTFAGLVSCSLKKAERSYRTDRIASEELYSIQRTFSIPPKVTGCSAIGTEVFHGRRFLFFWSFTTETFLQVITSEMVALVVLTAAVLMLAWYIRV
jgi:hypothetical protein